MFLAKINEVLTSKKAFFSDRINRATLLAALLANIIHWVLLISKVGSSEQTILLRYNVVYGTDFVERAAYIYLIPAIASLIFLLNLILSFNFYSKEKLAGYFLNFATVAVQILFLTASLILIVVNGF